MANKKTSAIPKYVMAQYPELHKNTMLPPKINRPLAVFVHILKSLIAGASGAMASTKSRVPSFSIAEGRSGSNKGDGR